MGTAGHRVEPDLCAGAPLTFAQTCRTRVLDGCVDHRDTLLTDPERADGMMLVCISRAAKGQRLILDL